MNETLDLQRDVTAAGATFPGMRIARMELRNFGTYDGATTVFDFDTRGAVLAGGNGSGKSTAFDAMKVAFVMNPKLNNATDSKDERSIPAYYRGIYGDTESEAGVTVAALRGLGNRERTTAILVKFENALGDVMCAIRLLYIDPAGKREWRYVISHRDVSLDHHFPRFETERVLRDRGAIRGDIVVSTFEAFMDEIARGLGMDGAKQAIRAFKLQAIASGLPVLDSTTRFAQDYILPPDDFLEDAAKAVEAIEKHRKVRARIAETEQQAEDLQPISYQIDQLEKAFFERSALRRGERQVNLLRKHADIRQARSMLRVSEKKEREISEEMSERGTRLDRNREEIEQLARTISDQGGDRIDQLKADRRAASAQRDARMDLASAILDQSAEAGIKGLSTTREGWEKLERAIPETARHLEERLQEIHAEMRKATIAHNAAAGEVQTLETDLEETRNSRSALGRELRAARDAIAESLGVEPDTLPFIAELLQVRDDSAADWEGAANRLLGSSSRTILVPEELYSRAKGLLPRLRTSAHVRLERVRDSALTPGAIRRAEEGYAALHAEALARRIDVKDDHVFAPFAKDFLVRRAPHVCVSDERFGHASGKAICPSGAISVSDDIAEIDNRRPVSDRGTFILGWSVERRIEFLQSQIDTARDRLDKAEERLSQCQAGQSVINGRKAALGTLEKIFKPWTDVDAAPLETRIDQLAEQITALESSEMRNMLARRDTLQQDIKDDDNALGHLRGQLGRHEQAIEDRSKRIDGLYRDIADDKATGIDIPLSDYRRLRIALARVRKTEPDTAPGFFERLFPVGEADVATVFQRLREQMSKDETQANQRVFSRQGALGKSAETYLETYDGERGRLSSAIRGEDPESQFNRNTWRQRLGEIEAQELPKARESADTFRKSTVQTEVSALKQRLITYDEEARRMIAGINRIMAGNVYNPASGTFARLHITRAKNDYVREFEALLDKALNNYTNQTDEESLENIAAIADYLKDTGDRRQDARRAQIARLANRFEAVVREVRHEEDGTETLVRRITGAGVLSGGEKERLSAFLLAAAMKGAFNAHDDTARHQALHTILVDEAFQRSTDESARASIEVLNSFDLQIIAATPMAKIRPFQPVIGSVFIVARPTNLQSCAVRYDIAEIDIENAEDDIDEDNIPVITDEAGPGE